MLLFNWINKVVWSSRSFFSVWIGLQAYSGRYRLLKLGFQTKLSWVTYILRIARLDAQNFNSDYR